MKLAELQAAFMEELRGREQPALRSQIVAGELSAQQRLAIYRATGGAACVQALELIYPVCRTIVGDDFFGQMARCYVDAHPASQSDLNSYGEAFAHFLQGLIAQEEVLAELPYIAGLAQLEWHYHAAYYAADDPAFDFLALEQLEPEQHNGIIWQCSASLALLQSSYPLAAIWRGNRDGEAIDSVLALSEREHLCIYRHNYLRNYELVVEVVDGKTYQLLVAVLAGESMGRLLDRYGAETAAQLPQLVQWGWICGFRLEPDL